MSMPKFRFDSHGIMIPTVLSHAFLQRIPTRAESLPPELPKTMPFAPDLLSTP